MEQVKTQIKLLSKNTVKVVKVNNIHDYEFYLLQAKRLMDNKYYLFERNSKNDKFVNFQGQKYYAFFNDNFLVFSTFTKSIIEVLKTNFNNICCICDVASNDIDDENFMIACDTCSSSFCLNCLKASLKYTHNSLCPVCRSNVDVRKI